MLGMSFELIALALGVRFIYLIYLAETPDPTRTYLPSLVLLAVCALTGGLLFVMGIVGEILRKHRRVTEEAVSLLRKLSLSKHPG